MPRALLLAVLAVLLAPSPVLGQQDLIGTWRFRSHTIEIRGDGTAVVDGETVRYAVRGTTLTFSGREGDTSYAFGVGRDTLRLESGGVIDTYKRVVPAAPPPTREPGAAPPTREPDAPPPTREPDAAPPTREPDAIEPPVSSEPGATTDRPPTSAEGTATRTIGPEGGVVDLGDGTRVELPPGAVGQDVSISVRAVDAEEHFPPREDRVRCVIECTAPVPRFSAPVRIHFPLPADATAEAAEGILAGYVDLERGMKTDLPCAFVETDGRKELIVETTHFTGFYMDRLKNLFASPPASRTVENVPYYNQGSSPYCWAACTQMICEAVMDEDTPGEIWDVIGRMKVPPTGLTTFTAAFSSTWSTVMRERTRVSPELQYWQASMVRLRNYIYEQIGLYGHPVLYSSGNLEHAVVIVGYDTTPAEPVFIVNDPGVVGTENVAYRRVTASKLHLGNEDSLSNAVVTAVLDKDVASRPAVRVSLATQCFGVNTVGGGASHLWTWDHSCPRGYSFKRNPLAETGSDVIPGVIATAEGKRFLEVSNATSTEQALSCDYSIRRDRNAVAQKHNYVVVPARGMVIVAVDEADFEAARDDGPEGAEFTFHVQLLKGGDFIDSALMDFSESQFRIRRPIGLEEQGVTKYDYEFSVEREGIPEQATFAWTFPDGGAQEVGETVRHEFETPGSYTIRVRATWSGGEAISSTVMVIAPDVAEKKAEANIYVFRWRKNKMGKNKQACQILHVAILNKEGQVIDGGHADAHNGLFSIVLPVGHYGYKVDYKYTNPPDSGSASGAFDVREGDRNWTDVETPPSEAFDK